MERWSDFGGLEAPISKPGALPLAVMPPAPMERAVVAPALLGALGEQPAGEKSAAD